MGITHPWHCKLELALSQIKTNSDNESQSAKQMRISLQTNGEFNMPLITGHDAKNKKRA